MSADHTIVISMPGADIATMAEERGRLLDQVHPDTAVVVTCGVAQEAELEGLAVRAFTLLDPANGDPRTEGWRADRDLWVKRYYAYLESKHG